MRKSDAPGRSTVWPCLMVESIQAELQFLQTVFGAQVQQDIGAQEGALWQIRVHLGDALLLIGKAIEQSSPAGAMLYVRVDDVKGTFARAMDSGATLISAPTEQPSGTLEAGFKDPQGTIWWIGSPRQRLSNLKVEQRLREQRRRRL